MVKAHIRMRAAAWRKRLADPAVLASNAAAAAFAAHEADAAKDWEMCIVLANDGLARRLNRDFRGLDEPTNVLAFPAPRERGDPGYVGDVVVAFDTAAREADAASLPLNHHLAHLVVHGTLHLLGYDHRRADEAVAMERLETRILRRLGIGDPYTARNRAPSSGAWHG